jgi:hypothetical protein
MESAKAEVIYYYKNFLYAPERVIQTLPVIENEIEKVKRLSSRIFKKPKLQFNPGRCQVESYCATEPVSEETNVLQWWKEHSNVFPELSKMAKDILAIPGSSAPSERVNSEGREMLPYTRNRLSPEVIEATLVSKSYLKRIYGK